MVVFMGSLVFGLAGLMLSFEISVGADYVWSGPGMALSVHGFVHLFVRNIKLLVKKLLAT